MPIGPSYYDFFTELPEPFRAQRERIVEQLKAVDSSNEISSQQKFEEGARLVFERGEVEQMALEALGGVEGVKKHYFKAKKDQQIARQNKQALKNCSEIGIDPSVAKKGPNCNLISKLLRAKGQLEQLCLEPIGGFTTPLEDTLDQRFKEFVESSSQLDCITPNPTLTAEIERLTQTFNQKKQELFSYKEQQIAFNEQKQKTSARPHIVPDLDSGKVTCQVNYSCSRVEASFGPVVILEKGNRPNIQLGLDFSFNQTNSNTGYGVKTAISAKKGGCEVGVESTFSQTGLEHSFTAQIYGFSGYSGGLKVPSKSFKRMFHPSTLVNNSELFFGGTLQRGRLETNARFGVLPTKTLIDFIGCDPDEGQFHSGSVFIEKQNRTDCKQIDPDLELVLDQQGLQVAFPLAEIQQESDEQEDAFRQEKRETTVKRDHVQHMVPAPVPNNLVLSNGGLDFSHYALGALFLLRFLICIWELFCKFKNRNKGV